MLNNTARFTLTALALSVGAAGICAQPRGDMPPMPPATEIPFIPDKVVTVALPDGTEIELLESEIELMRQKKKSLQKYRYENDYLDDERQSIKEDQRAHKKDDAMESQFPLTAEEVTEIRLREMAVRKAENSPVVKEVEMLSRTIELDIESPHPIEISVSRGFASSIAFFDETGAPWPIIGDKVIADESSFTATVLESNPHVAVFEIKREFAQSNALMTLQDIPLPVSLKLSGEEGKVDSRLIVRLPMLGPLSTALPTRSARHQIENVSGAMLEMLNGGRLSGGKEYELKGVDGTVFVRGGRMYVRTKAFLKAPPALAEQISPTGINVYELVPVIRLLFSVGGTQVHAMVDEKPQIQLHKRPGLFDGQ